MIALIVSLCLLNSEADSQENRRAEAETRYAETLKEAKRLDPEGLPVGIVFNNLGYHYWSLGQIREATRKYAQALEIFERKLPRSHNYVINASLNLSGAYLELGEISKAESLLRRFLTAEAELSFENRAALLGDLGSVLMQQGDFGESERVFRKALTLLEKETNESTLVRRVIAWSNLSAVFGQSGRLSDALEYSRRARAVMDAIISRVPRRAS